MLFLNMHVYLISNDFIRFKIGSSKHPQKRLKELQTGNGDNLILLKTYLSPKYYKKIELALHNTYSHKNKIGEWFLLTEDDINSFENMCKTIEDTFIFLDYNRI